MPQLIPADFLPQIFWLAVSFAVLYVLMARISLPKIADVLEARQDRLNGDLDTAAKFKEEAEKAIAEYEKALADARAKALALGAETRGRHAAEAAKRAAELEAKLAAEAKQAEQRIAAAKAKALASVREIATETAAVLVEKLIGARPSASEARAAVDAAVARK
jgi:F-type H+-transporting ATPase subunit b